MAPHYTQSSFKRWFTHYYLHFCIFIIGGTLLGCVIWAVIQGRKKDFGADGDNSTFDPGRRSTSCLAPVADELGLYHREQDEGHLGVNLSITTGTSNACCGKSTGTCCEPAYPLGILPFCIPQNTICCHTGSCKVNETCCNDKCCGEDGVCALSSNGYNCCSLDNATCDASPVCVDAFDNQCTWSIPPPAICCPKNAPFCRLVDGQAAPSCYVTSPLSAAASLVSGLLGPQVFTEATSASLNVLPGSATVANLVQPSSSFPSPFAITTHATSVSALCYDDKKLTALPCSSSTSSATSTTDITEKTDGLFSPPGVIDLASAPSSRRLLSLEIALALPLLALVASLVR